MGIEWIIAGLGIGLVINLVIFVVRRARMSVRLIGNRLMLGIECYYERMEYEVRMIFVLFEWND